MADIVSFSEKASAIRTISWSCDNRIAICTDEGIKSLILQCKVNNSANKPFFVQTDIPVNPDVWDIPKYTDKHHKQLMLNLSRDVYTTLIADKIMNPFKANQDTQPRTGYALCEWSTNGGDKLGRCILATVSHDFRLCLFTQENSFFNWTKIVELSSIEYRDTRPPDNLMKPENYHAFKKWCYSFTLSAMNWYRETVQDPDSGQTFSLLAVGNRIGGVIVWRVRMPCTDESDCSVVYRMHDGRERKVSSLKWSKQGYLAVGYVDGPVHLLQFDVKHPKNAPTMIELYTDSDQLAVADMTFIYNEQMNRQCLLAAKEHCQLVFILESGCDPHQLKLVSKSHVFGENLFPSTGFYVLDECSAVVVSQDRMSQKITLDWEKSEASISTVDTNVAGKREYICVGVAHSVNQALIIHVLRPKAGSDIHAAQFKMKATNLHVQSFADIPHEITPKQSVDCKLEDTSEKLGNLLDSLELFRRSVLANYPVDISMDCSSVEKLLRCVQLKRYAAAVHLHKLSDKLRGQIFPTQMSLDEEQKQDEVFKQFTTQVVIINLCLSLDNYLTWKTTQPQTQADGSHIVQLMCEFIQDNIQNYPQIKQAFPDIEEKINQLQTDTAAREDVKCCICPSNLKLENMAWVCPNGHVYVMCSKTLLPCEFLDYKMCNNCKSNCRPESADVQWLAGDPLRCTFCDSLMFCT